ncbi:mannitol-1-phosphate 5-dehydrogenase [Carnobacterium sp. PL24RED07]|uniref:mannitol-1-phosphate 5-dehydrogenase n=1 Tax=unclassified Carnobacterium TaxID=257487 RepID=UPI0011EC8E52|nr:MULTISPECIES: mannitol-1-phosphate 5-dehydrogenase [unclassified Carnobacterium]KAF3303475.1 mannitol-1-phosphate 5-dehydrogenase [Carnobacterium sp. PL26RED25]KAF3306933.1 mannitol-1-phosphate 5-dehydrogenase [Carnobacterium sp. PL24RED07]
MKAVHFGAGNIGRGFIGEILHKNGFDITFVDINETLIDALNARDSYEIEYADEAHQRLTISGFSGLNNGKEPEAVAQAVAEADIVTTAIGPNILPYIAELIANGIKLRRENDDTRPMDIVACENMIGGTDFLNEKVSAYFDEADRIYVDQYIGFPNAAVDRIVPMQSHEDPLFVSVEPFSEWVIDQTNVKGTQIQLEGVLYVEDLLPYIERKLFSVNTGHATTAYTGKHFGYETIDQALKDDNVLQQLQAVLAETGALLVEKWGFDQEAHAAYANKIVGRFQNSHISDAITRVARTPIRKLGYDERFIRPIREAKERGLAYDALLETVAYVFEYSDADDEQSQELQKMLADQPLDQVIQTVTGLEDADLVAEIASKIK